MVWLRRLMALLHRRQLHADLTEEMDFHLEMRRERFVSQGMPEDEARRAARLYFGNITQAKEHSREFWGFRCLDELGQDLRGAVRAFQKHPGSTLAAVATFALGLGVATAVFSVVNGVYLQPLPYRDADRLVMAWGVNPEHGSDLARQRNAGSSMSVHEYLDWQKDLGVFERVVAFNSFLVSMSNTDDPETIFGYGSTAGLFPMLGVEPMLGRGFLPEEEQPGGEPVIVLTHDFWQRRFRGDPDIIGDHIEGNRRRWRIVGVMPPGFVFFNRQVDVLLPYPVESDMLSSPRSARYWRVMGRIEQGLSLEQAQVQADVFSASLARQHPESNKGWSVRHIPVSEDSAGHLWPAMKALLGGTAFLLLIACSNIVNLRLVHALARSKEFALRTTFGADRWRLMRLMLTESLVLGTAGGATGLVLAWAIISYFQTLLPDRYTFGKYMLQAEAIRMDPWVTGFAVAVTLGTALLVGLIPAWRSANPDLLEALSETGKGSAGGRKSNRLHKALVLAEVALAVLMVTGAGLLVRSFAALYQQGVGIEAGNILTAYVRLPFGDLREQVEREQLRGRQVSELFQTAFRTRRNSILEEGARQPGVEALAAGNLPLDTWYSMNEFSIEGRAEEFADNPPRAATRSISANYMSVLGIPLLAGRMFDERDHHDAPRVVVISQEVARRYFAGEDPIGQSIRRRSSQYTIIGIAGDVRVDGMDRPAAPILYFPLDQSSSMDLHLLAKTRGEPMAILPQLRTTVQSAVPGASAGRPRTLEALVRDSVYEVHYSMLLMSGLALLALTLAIVGVYAMLSFAVRERTREIGIRMSLGAHRSQVLRQIVREGVALAAGGVVFGLVAAAGLTGFLSTLLFGVEPLDPWTFAVVGGLLIFTGGLASYLPARRAARVSPMTALRHE